MKQKLLTVTKIRRTPIRERTEIQAQEKVIQPPINIYFDGRKGKTLTTEGKEKLIVKGSLTKNTLFGKSFLQSIYCTSTHP